MMLKTKTAREMLESSRVRRRAFSLGLGATACHALLALGALGCSGEAPESSGQELATSEAALRDDGGPRLAHYTETYMRWLFGDKTLPTDANGNAVENKVVMLPVPQTPGDGTPGTANVTLSPGESFVAPLFGGLGTSYRDGTPPDPFEPLSIFTTLDISFSVDGQTLIAPSNVLRYFSKFKFDPPIPIDDPVVSAVIWFEGVSVLHAPLGPGQHVLKLDVKNTEPSFGQLLEYHNTWNITVQGH
jgi:hypothetical protein